MKQTNENNQDIKNIENKVPEEKHTLDGKHHDGTSQSSVNSVATKNDIHPAVCFYKPSPSPILRQKQRPISIFEICPKDTEITEVKDICIETGTKQNVMESHSNLPALTSNVHILDGCTLTDLPTTRRTPKSSDKHFEVCLRNLSTIILTGSFVPIETSRRLRMTARKLTLRKTEAAMFGFTFI